LTLNDAAPRDRIIVRTISRGWGAWKMLVELGIFPGAELEVIACHPLNGPIVVKAGDTQVAIGRRLAASIEVEKV